MSADHPFHTQASSRRREERQREDDETTGRTGIAMDGQQHRQHPQIPHSSSDSATHLHPPLSSISSSTASTSTRTRTRTRTTTSFRVSVSRVDDMAGLLHETEEDGQHDNTFSRHQRSRSFPVLSSSSSSSQQRRHQYHYYHHHHHHTSNHLQRSSDEDNSGDEEERAIAEEIKRLRLQREIENEDSDRQKGWRDGKEARLAGVDPTLSTCTTTTTTTSYPLPSPSSSSTRRHRPPSSSSLKDGQHLTDTLETPTSRSSRRSKGKKIRPSASSSSLNDASSTGSSQVASPSSSSPRHRHRSHRHRGARSSMTVPSSPTFGATKAFDRDGPSIPPGSRLFERRAAPSDVSHHSSSVISAFDFQKLSPTAYLSKVYSSLPKPRAPIPVPPLRDSVPSSIQLVSHRLRSYDLVPLQKALSLSFYLFLSVGAGLALVAILVTSYLLTIADDARVRVHQMSDRAYAVRNWMASNSRGGGGDGAAAASDENRGEKDYHPHPNSSTSAPHSQHGSSSNGSTPFSTPSSSTPGSPRLGRRDLPTDDARGTRKQASSNKRWNEFLPLSFSLFFSGIRRLFSHAFNTASSTSSRGSNPRPGSFGSQDSLPRPPLKTLIPSFVLALLIAVLGILQTTSFWKESPSYQQKPSRFAAPHRDGSKSRTQSGKSSSSSSSSSRRRRQRTSDTVS